MKTKSIIAVIIMLIISACNSKQTNTNEKEVIRQELILPNGEYVQMIVSLSHEDSTYLISFETKDKNSRIYFHEERSFTTVHSSYAEDSIIVNSKEMSVNYLLSYIVGEPGDYGWMKTKHHTIVDILAKTELSNDKFTYIAKVEFFPDNYFHPTKIERIVLWKAPEIYQNK